ncbi:MAG: aldo/keto reductase [Streptosporangiaceae bacterium]
MCVGQPRLLPVAQHHGMGVIVWSPLAQGLLTRRIRKGQPTDLRRTPYSATCATPSARTCAAARSASAPPPDASQVRSRAGLRPALGRGARSMFQPPTARRTRTPANSRASPRCRCARRRTGVKIGGGTARDVVFSMVAVEAAG